MQWYSLNDGTFEQEVRESWKTWWLFGRRLTADEERAKDLVQTVLERIVRRLKVAPLPIRESLRSYVLSSIRKEFYRQWHQEQRIKTVPFSIELLMEACDAEDRDE